MFNLTPQGWRYPHPALGRLFFFRHGDPERNHLAHQDDGLLGEF